MRQTICLDEGWQFHLGEIEVPEAKLKSPMYIEAKTERKRTGPAAREYLDGGEYYSEHGLISHETWTRVDLPHDYIISQEPRRENNETLGYFRYENAWYRRHFTLDAPERDQRVVVYFEGVGIHSTVYFNGCRMLHNHCGYNSFEVDLSDVIEYGADNVLAVHIETDEHEGWWYEGAGIYRHVYLEVTETVSLDRYGVYVHPEKLEGDLWRVPVETTVRCDRLTDGEITVRTQLFDETGACAAQAEGRLTVPAYGRATLHQEMTVERPLLWDVDDVHLYTAKTELLADGEVIDEAQNRFGFRTIRYDANEGFFLNGRHVKIKGVCCHQDYGLTGKAVPERVQRYRLQLMKEMGANGYRTAHYPHHPYTMDALDELGFLVMDETRWFESTPDGMAQLEMLIKRDRNHPSVILWSVGNEEPTHMTSVGFRIARTMMAAARKLDATRPVTTAVSNDPLICDVMNSVDVVGVNYNLLDWEKIHEKHPEKPFVITECCATGTTRGWYYADSPARGYIYGYDRDTNRSFLSRENTWKKVMSLPYLAGEYQWAGIEHRGETVWPRLCSQSGAVDLYLNRKDAFYQNQSHWLDAPMAHLLPHWNWPGREGEKIRVSCYSNCEEVMLFLNGRGLGTVRLNPYDHAEWQVPYEPGRLEVVGLRGGEIVCRDVHETTGRPVRLRLRLESGEDVRADGKDVAVLTCDCVDAEGRHVPDAEPLVRFMTNELGAVAGTGSDISDHTPVTCPDRKMRAGLISVLVRAGKSAGTLRVYAEADGLQGASLSIELK